MYKPNSPDTTNMELAETMLIGIEEAGQRAVAQAQEWLLAKKVALPGLDNFHDSRKDLEALGFQVGEETGELFYVVIPPDGWTKNTDGFWTTIRDDSNKDVIMQFFKSAAYEREAFLDFLP